MCLCLCVCLPIQLSRGSYMLCPGHTQKNWNNQLGLPVKGKEHISSDKRPHSLWHIKSFLDENPLVIQSYRTQERSLCLTHSLCLSHSSFFAFTFNLVRRVRVERVTKMKNGMEKISSDTGTKAHRNDNKTKQHTWKWYIFMRQRLKIIFHV